MKFYIVALILTVITVMFVPTVGACAPGDPDEGTSPCQVVTNK